ncbi:MAG: hypothetical protein GY929_22210 [Actinomycetia bacterium]|nr:hypothetical protein [Actinomycetes bacterium]
MGTGIESESEFDRTTAAGRRAEMAYLDSLTDGELAEVDPGHRYVTQNPAETPDQRAVLLKRLADAEARRESLARQHR